MKWDSFVPRKSWTHFSVRNFFTCVCVCDWMPLFNQRPDTVRGGTRLVPLVVQGLMEKISKDLLRGRLMTWSVSPCENKWCCKNLAELERRAGGAHFAKINDQKKKEELLFIVCFPFDTLLTVHIITLNILLFHCRLTWKTCFQFSPLKSFNFFFFFLFFKSSDTEKVWTV